MSKAPRTCVACRQEGDRADLVRLVVSPQGEVVLDYRGKLPGRGAWVHPTPTCTGAVDNKPKILARAFKAAVSPINLAAAVKSAVVRSAAQGLSQAAAGGGIVSGHDALISALKRNEVVAVAVANDAADRTLRHVRAAASKNVIVVELPVDCESLGVQIGHSSRAAVGAIRAPSASHLICQLHRLALWG